jgi:succinate-semialdehyde dehydrogenase/glutarate-semialdehyde dehydrogenase
MSIQSINPISGKIVKTYTEDLERQIGKKIEDAQAARLKWRETSFEERKALLSKTGAVLREREKELAILMATEMGKPLKDGIAEAVSNIFMPGD